jgi:hypothetical protein
MQALNSPFQSSFFHEEGSVVRSPGFEPGIASLEGLCPNQLDDDRFAFRQYIIEVG